MPGLDPLFNAFNDPKNIVIACMGDSDTFGTGTTNLLGWPGALRSIAAARWGTGSDGLHTRDRNTTISGTWTKATTSDAWDRSPGLAVGAFSAIGTYLANGSANIWIWTKPSYLTVDGFYIWAVDGASSGNFSYSTDGGTTWNNVSVTWNQTNSIKRILVNTSITGTNTVQVRAANASGTAVNTYIMGIEPITKKSTYTIHNWGAAGQFSINFVRNTAGNWHEALDLLQPQLVTYMITNDIVLDPVANDWKPTVQTLASTVTGYGGSMLFMNFFEQYQRDVTAQANYRAMIKDVAASYGMPIIDFYDLVPGGYQGSVDAGYVNATDIHPNDAGATFMAQQIWKVISKPYRGAQFRT